MEPNTAPPNPRPKIDYPPLPTRKWVPPDKRVKKKPEPKYVKPPGISQPLKISSLARVWRKFKIVNRRTILIGSYSQTHKRFRPKSNGFQGPCNCAMAICYSEIYPMKIWDTWVLDQILDMGDKLYLATLMELKDRCKTTLKVSEINTSFFFEQNKIFINREEPYDGKILDDFEETLDNVFSDGHQSGIVTTQNKFWAFWMSGAAYFLFDPAEHDAKSARWRGVPGLGFCFCMRCSSTEGLTKVILENVSIRTNTVFQIFPISMSRKLKVNTTPPALELNTHCAVPREEPEPLPEPEPEPEEEEEETEKIIAVQDMESEVVEVLNEQEEYSPELFKPKDGEPPAVEAPEISPSRLPTVRTKTESITYFGNVVPFKVGILRASTFQGDPRFSSYHGKQSLGNALAALTMLRLYKSKNWFHKIIDEVLILGEQIHKDSVQALPSGKTLKISTMCKKITLETREFAPDIEEFTTMGKLQSPNADVLDLLPTLEEFFRNNDTGVVSGPLIVAVWKEDGFYYMFDPNERDHNGLVIMKTLRVGSEIQVLNYTPGVACITWFSNLKDLVTVYMENVDRPNRRDLFYFSRVLINDYVYIPDNWNNFEGVCPGKWIIKGTFNQNDRRFDAESRNSQCTATATVALAYALLKPVKKWKTEDVDEVLLQGDTFYKRCVKALQDSSKFIDKKLLVDELLRKFPIEDKEVQLDIQDCLINGLLDAKDDNDALNLKKGMEEFFKENETAVVTARFISVAIWKNDEVYYYFDSHSRDDAGVVTGFGNACVLRILTIEDLAATILGNLGAGADMTYNISRVGVKIWEMSEDGIIRPPLNNYTEIDPDAAILRSIFNERSSVFRIINRGRQTVPMCLAAVGMKKLYPSTFWTLDILNEVLTVGDKLYTATMVARENTRGLPEENDIDEVYAENCLMEYNIGVNKFILSYEPAAEGNFEQHFKEAMATFYNEPNVDEDNEKELLMESDFYTVITWCQDAIYYLFDPQPRDDTGQIFGKDEWSLKMEEEEGEDIYPTAIFGAGDAADNPATPVEDAQRRSVASQASEGDDGTKHSAKYWRTMEDSEGKSCILRFLNLDKLIEHVYENTPPNKRLDLLFKLFPVKIVNKPELKTVYNPEEGGEMEDNYDGDWYDFKELDHGRWILRGTYTSMHELFPPHNRGRQSVAMCYSAMGYSKRYALCKFTSITVNEILKYGDKLHTATRNIRKKEFSKAQKLSEDAIEELLNKQTFGIGEIARAFCIGTDQMRAEVTPEVLRGDIHAQQDDPVLNVPKALEVYFADNRFGLLACKNLTVAIWKGVTVYYMFDPNSRGPSGIVCENGEACITRYLRMEVMAEVFVKNLQIEGNNTFTIHQVNLKICPCPREPKPAEKIRVEERPKFGAYDVVLPGKKILRGTLHQDHEQFGRGKNVQCAAIAVIALTMTLLHKASIWTKPFIDEILIIGDELYVASLDTLGYNFNPWEQGLTLHLVNRDYKIGALRANCEIRTMDQRGIIDIKHPKIMNIRAGIDKFFEENTHGVIETETLTVAIWEEEDEPDLIYMYDPNRRGPDGLPFNAGVACVVTFESSKMAADHFIASIVDKSKRTGEFVILPVEIVVGTKRTKRKRSIKKAKGPSKFCRPDEQQKKKLREIAAERRAKKEAARLAKIGRNEYNLMSGPDPIAILRGTRSQTSKHYDVSTQGKQDITNCYAAFVLHRLVTINTWYYKHIDKVLDVGDQLYKDSYITYGPCSDPKLGFKNILRKVFIKEVTVALQVYKPVMTNTLTALNLELALVNYFQQEPFGILSANNQHVGLFFKQGLYYMFDPHDRDIKGFRCDSGCACVLRFLTLPSLCNRYMENIIAIDDSIKVFTITPVTIGSITKKGVPQDL